jgi:hypothetical protein
MDLGKYPVQSKIIVLSLAWCRLVGMGRSMVDEVCGFWLVS